MNDGSLGSRFFVFEDQLVKLRGDMRNIGKVIRMGEQLFFFFFGELFDAVFEFHGR